MTAVVIGITLNSGAYLTEILRAGVISVRRAELEAAETLGMSRLQTVQYVMLPHIAKTIYAPLCNFFVWLVLGSSIAAIFGVEELTGRAINISTSNLRHIETFSVVAVDLRGADLRGEHRAGARRPLGISREGEGVLMLDRLIEEVPRFFNYYNMIFMLQAMLRTLALTVVGCTVGFLCGLVLAVLRQTQAPLLLPGAARGDRLCGRCSAAFRSW